MKDINRYKIIIADPSVVLCAGLEKLLNADPEIVVTGIFHDFDSLSDKAWQLKPDVILFNPILVSCHKRFAIRHILKEFQDTVMIALLYSYVVPDIVSEFNDSIDIFEKPEKIVQKIKSTVGRLASQPAHDQNASNSADLSDRETEILVAVAQGMTNKEIAEKHNISIHTVISHRKNITRKTGIRTVSGLTVYAMLNNLLS